MYTNNDITGIQEKAVLFSCSLLSNNPYFVGSQRFLGVLMTLINRCLDFGFLFQGVTIYIYLVSPSW